MLVTWKYQLSKFGITKVKMPAGAKIFSYQLQHGEHVMWATVDPDKRLEFRYFNLYATGQPIEENVILPAIGTSQEGEESFVLHLYELVAEPQIIARIKVEVSQMQYTTN